MSTYWQIAAGSAGRDYTKQFLQFGMAFVGGDKQKATMRETRPGDVIVLKRGTQKILAVGLVVQRAGKHNGVNDKTWLRDFDGWDLAAYCYVDWKRPDQPLSVHGLTRSTIQKLSKSGLRKLADDILRTGRPVPLIPEPPETAPVDLDAILRFLIKEGLRPSAADELTKTVYRIRLLADYYRSHCTWEDVREHETRTFLVVPLLLALGWSEQQIKIELPCKAGRVDIACFPMGYRRRDNECTTIIETKDFSSGLHYAQAQAKAYTAHFPNCRTVVVTNGYCYKTYRRNASSEFRLQPSAYLNLFNPTKEYPLDPENVKGALEAIKSLLPHSVE